MKKSQLIKELAIQKNLSSKDSEVVVETVFEEMSAYLESLSEAPVCFRKAMVEAYPCLSI
jgi:nucleoid DNA-binding protein